MDSPGQFMDAHHESTIENEENEAGQWNRKLYHNPTRRPAEVEAGPAHSEEYKLYRALTDLREPYRIPAPYLKDTKKFAAPELPEAPLIVFINSKSGGHAGPKLTEVLYHALGHAQVFDLQEYRPGPVLRRIWKNYEAKEREGDSWAPIVRRKMRILAAGGDGTVAWILKTIRELDLDPEPYVAVMPLGTGNDLSLSFGWGNTFLQSWIDRHITIYETLKRIGDSEPRRLDTWSISLTSDMGDIFKELPHSLEAVDTTSVSAPGPKDVTKVKGLFWNYFSLGLDAQAAYGFHSLREKRPWAAPSRTINQAWYSYFSCTTGWFCCAPPVRNKVSLKVKNVAGEWKEVAMSRGIKALVVLNLQSYAGGRDLWGLRDPSRDAKKGWKTPIFNDGVIEVVGLRNGYQTALVMAGLTTKIHAKRLAQGTEILLDLRAGGVTKGDTSLTHMQLDGEPWPQIIPAWQKEPLSVHIKHVGTAGMLFNPEKLRGIAPKIQKLAARERTISLAVQGDASEKPLPAGLGGAGSPGPVQLADMNGGGGRKAGAAESAAASADTTPLRRMVSTPLEAGEAPRVEIVPGVLDSGESEEEQGRRKSKTEDSAMKPGTDVLEDSPVRAPSTQEPPPDQEPSPARSAAQLDTDPIDPKTPDRPITRR